MLTDFRVHPTLPAQDMDRARTFYVETLGLEPASENPAGIFFNCAEGSRFFVFKSEGRPSGDHTQAGFAVDDLDAVVDDLRGRGVEVDGPNDLGAIKNAFFRDSEGNVIGMVEFVSAPDAPV